jgi:site-specific DNA recombinase
LRVGIYVRVSTDEQVRHGYSIAEQEEAGRKRALEIAGERAEVHVFSDPGQSGAALDRPGLTRLREWAREGRLDVLIVRDLDRLSRKLAHQLLLTEEFEKAGVRLEFLDHEWKNTPEGRLFSSIRGAFSEYEREKIRERMVRCKLQKARMGGLPTYQEPYGYRQENGKLVEDPAEAEVVRQIYRWFTTEDIGPGAVAERLADMGIPSPKGCSFWHRSVVKRLLSNPAYKGELAYNRARWEKSGGIRRKVEDRKASEWVLVPVPPLVDAATWERAQEKLAEARRKYSGWSKENYLLSGIITCTDCGNPMHGICHRRKSGKKDRYYTCCRDYTDPHKQGCRPRKLLRADGVEAAVWDLVVSWLNDPEALAAELKNGMEPENLRADLERIEKRLSEVRKGRSNVLRALASGLADLDSDSTKLLNELRERERRLEARRREIEAALLRSAADESRIKDVCRRAKEYLGMLDTLSFDQKRALVRTLVRQVTVSGGGGDFQVTVYAAFAPAAAAVAVEKGRK